MILEKYQHVICCLKNNAILEGTVELWSDDEAILLSLDRQSRLIIPHPDTDIVFIKIILNSTDQSSLPEVKQNVYNKLQEVIKEPNEDLRKHNINHLKRLLNDQERKIIKEKIKEHRLGDARTVKYGTPGFLPQPRSE